MKEIEEMQQYFPVICGEWCLFNSLACGWDTKGGQTVLNGLEGASVETYTPEVVTFDGATQSLWRKNAERGLG